MKIIQVLITFLIVICLNDTLKPMEPRQNIEASLDALNTRARMPNLSVSDLCTLLAEAFQLLQCVDYNQPLSDRISESIRYLRNRIELVMDVYDGPPSPIGIYNADEAIREIYRRKLAQTSERSGWYGNIQQGNSPYWG